MPDCMACSRGMVGVNIPTNVRYRESSGEPDYYGGGSIFSRKMEMPVNYGLPIRNGLNVALGY